MARTANPLTRQGLRQHLMHDIAVQYMIGTVTEPVHSHKLTTGL